ncbi:precorrin-2 C(20)-methyltransferase [Tropicibacter naphthalenivorans]|uniref:Precorrin-2 C(20)-methyltransferase n=1 Tax=Tropicibacter naphthalenivorans TaxID=441103 RepID=A0A0P1GW40_9RHOB|nr:precorrin-2 C(20)-methyltransferase [Tropicibacter naphthalenivorans]CUH80827.1 Precorrin-2 C(20)-methyltransferase [Tropicibacter naphthalenivorans]SMC90418.1 precorrin-2 C20-methyltransferase [Tropicibacter naphthalenivorans]
MSVGTIHGVGLGPGDPDLMSVRAHRLLTGAKHVAFFRKAGRTGQARKIIDGLLREDVVEYPMDYPVTTEIPLTDPRYNQALSAFYEEASAHLRALAEGGEDVVVLSEGDPFFFGSFMHIYTRVRDHVPVQVVPAITGMAAAWTATGEPITWGDDVLTVLMGTLNEAEMRARMQTTDALVVMKIGRNIDKVVGALKAAGKYDDAWLVEYASMPNQTVHKLADVEGRVTPYFSIIIVHGQGRRP